MDRPIELPSRSVCLGLIGLFFVLTLGVYGASLKNDFVRWDDGLLIYENNAVREMSLTSIKTAFTTYDPELYIPLTLMSYKMDYLIGGRNPFLYHFHNLVLHTLNAVLVTSLLFLFFQNRWLAILLGVLFAVHPLHTEAVVWASARKDLLSTFFFLSSLLMYLWWRSVEGVEGAASTELSTRSGVKVKRMYLFSIGLFLLGLLSKVMVLTLPLILFLIDWKEGTSLRSPEASFGRQGSWNKRLILEKVPYIALSVLFGVIALYGKRDVTSSATLLETLLMSFKSTVFYLSKLVLPTNLSVLYPYTESIRLSSPDFFVPLLILVTLIGFLAYSLRYTKALLFGFLFFLVTLLPTFVNFSKGGDYYFASDRYAYLPSLGFFFLLGWGIQRFFLQEERYAVMKQKMRGLLVGVGIVTAIFMVLTFRQSLVWADTMTLFQHVALHYPNAHRARNNLGNAYRRQGLLDKAIVELKAALEIREEPKTLSNLGAVYRKKGQMSEALAVYEKAIVIAPKDPEPHFGLGLVFAEQRKFAEALASYDRALALDPAYADVRSNIGALFMQQGRVEEAIAEYRKAIAIDPYHIQARFNLAVALVKLSKFSEAIEEYEEVVVREPTFIPARINLGILLYEDGKIAEAREQFQEVLMIDPRNVSAKTALEQIGTSP